MSKNKKDKQKEFQDLLEIKVDEKKNSDWILELTEKIKEVYNIELQPIKNRTKHNLLRAIKYLSEKYDFRYNEINTDTEYKLKGDKNFQYFDDRDYRTIYLDLKKNGGINLPDSDYKNIIYSEELSRKFNPFKEYLFSLPKWDKKTDWIELFLRQIYLKEEKQRSYLVKGFKKWFVALVVSLIKDEPDRKYINHSCLVLVGGQGKYKSSFLESIVPPHLRMKYFYGSNFQVHNKDHEKYLAFKILIDLDELAAFNKTDIESMKSKITQPQIVVRLPYTKADIHLKRRASFCGSINNAQFLKDDSGSRRFLIIETPGITLDESFDIDRIYSQALFLFRDGFKYWFDSDDIEGIEKHNEGYRLKTFEEELIQYHFKVPDQEDYIRNRVEYLSATDIANFLADKHNRINVNNTVIKNVGSIMKRLGYEKKSRRLNGKVVSLYDICTVFEPKAIPLEQNENRDDDIF